MAFDEAEEARKTMMMMQAKTRHLPENGSYINNNAADKKEIAGILGNQRATMRLRLPPVHMLHSFSHEYGVIKKFESEILDPPNSLWLLR